MFFLLSVNAKESGGISSIYDGGTDYGKCMLTCIAKIDAGSGKVCFCTFENDMSRGSGPRPQNLKYFDTLEQALNELQVLLLRRLVAFRMNILIGMECRQFWSDSQTLEEFTVSERTEIDNFLKRKFLDISSDYSTASSETGYNKPVKVVAKFVPDDGDCDDEELNFYLFTEDEISDVSSNSDHSSPDHFPGKEKTQPIRITTKFVEVGGGTEGRGFDWVDKPFGCKTTEH